MWSSALMYTFLLLASSVSAIPLVIDQTKNVTYQGVSKNGVESFYNIAFGKDTSGARRFAPPEAYVIPSGSMYNATVTGPVCPQVLAGGFAYQSEATNQSEDCLRLKVARPMAINSTSKLPVMVYIYGGGLYNGHINERTATPDGLILESVANGLPVVYVAMNYRLNIFGFALSEALESNSLNVGLRDQRLALEWVQENIEAFGGDPSRVTIFGQSSGALSVTLQILAYGGTQGAPFHGGIMQSTALEPTMTSNLTRITYNGVAELSGCTSSSGDPQSTSTLQCLRDLPFESLMNYTIAQQSATSADNDGDTWLPTVDGDFLPVAASQLVAEGRFAKMPVMIGWMQDDATLFTSTAIETAADTEAFVRLYWKALTNSTISNLLSFYPVTDFKANTTASLSAEFYRSAQIFRDILLTCPSFYFGHAMSQKYTSNATASNYIAPWSSSTKQIQNFAPVYLYNHNQTIIDAYLDSIGDPGLGVIHTSDLEYVFGNLSLYYVNDQTYDPSPSDYLLKQQMSRSWSTFAHLGRPSLGGTSTTLPSWDAAYKLGDGLGDARIYVSGGPEMGSSKLDGKGATKGVKRQKLRERCGFLQSPDIIEQLQY